MHFFLSGCAPIPANTLLVAWGAPSFQELIVILIIILIIFGAKRLPELARALGQSMNEFRKAKDEFEKEFHKSANDTPPTPPAAVPPPQTPAAQITPAPQPAPQTVSTAPAHPVETPANPPPKNPLPEDRSV